MALSLKECVPYSPGTVTSKDVDVAAVAWAEVVVGRNSDKGRRDVRPE